MSAFTQITVSNIRPLFVFTRLLPQTFIKKNNTNKRLEENRGEIILQMCGNAFHMNKYKINFQVPDIESRWEC